MKAFALFVLAACNEPGEITVRFDVDALATCGYSAQALIYAVRGTTCDACVCGECFGRGSAQVIGCQRDCMFDGVDLDLDPGHWAVVVETRDETDRLVGSQCIEIDVDRDGTSSRSVVADAPTCASACL